MPSACMRVAQYQSYGPLENLAIAQAPVPRPARGQVQVRIARAALNPKDYLLRSGQFRPLSGRRFPKLSGLDFAGEVRESRNPAYPPGSRVFGFLNEWTGQRGTLAEVVCAHPSELAHLPLDVGEEAGAAVALVGTTCLQALRDIGRVREGARVLIHGASGGVGTMAIQIARLLGARVTSLSSERNRALCEELGAEEARHYGELVDAREQAKYDCVLDAHGSLSAKQLGFALKPGATFVSTVPTFARLVRSVLTRGARVHERVVMVRPRAGDLSQLGTWLAERKLQPVVDARFAFEEIGEAFARLESRRSRGKVIIALT